jgi:hypothetical protein
MITNRTRSYNKNYAPINDGLKIIESVTALDVPKEAYVYCINQYTQKVVQSGVSYNGTILFYNLNRFIPYLVLALDYTKTYVPVCISDRYASLDGT